MDKVLIDLTQMREGEKGLVVDIQGGIGLVKRLEVLGIRKGCEIQKVSSQIMRGPVVLKTGNTQVAIGFGMARKIIVEKAVSTSNEKNTSRRES